MKICQEPPIHWDEEIYLFFFYMLLSFRSKVNTFMGLRDISKFLTKWLLAVSVLTPACVYKNSFYHSHTCAAKSLQSCPTLCDPIDGSPPGSTVPGILQARTLEWVAISFSNAGKWKAKVKSLSRVWLFATPWTAAYQAPLSLGFSRQEYWNGVPSPSPLAFLIFP